MERLEPRPFLPGARQPVEPARVPRRFGVGALLSLVTLFGLVFSMLRAVEAHAAVYLGVGGFLIVIALAQMVLFQGKKPRLASFMAGGVYCSALVVGASVVSAAQGRPPPANFLIGPFLFGGLLGYLAGCVLAGVFLLLKSLHQQEPESDDGSPLAADEGDKSHADPA
jgi:drug/metabolite transporter superfamily protein YnfA